MKTDLQHKHGGQHHSGVSILPLLAAWQKELKEGGNNNWQNAVIHVGCNKKCLEFSANLCMYSSFDLRTAGKTQDSETQQNDSHFAFGLFRL